MAASQSYIRILPIKKNVKMFYSCLCILGIYKKCFMQPERFLALWFENKVESNGCHSSFGNVTKLKYQELTLSEWNSWLVMEI